VKASTFCNLPANGSAKLSANVSAQRFRESLCQYRRLWLFEGSQYLSAMDIETHMQLSLLKSFAGSLSKFDMVNMLA
jgi:hypothetical protein